MSRPLLFLIVFAVGLALLLIVQLALERRRAPEGLPGEPAARGEAPQAPGRPATGELPEGGSFQIGGQTEFSRYGGPGGPLLYRVKAEDVRSAGGDAYDLLGVVLELYDAETGLLRTTLAAERARVQGRLTEAGFELEQSFENQLAEVEAVLHTGTPLAPLRFQAPALSVSLDDQRLATDEPVRIEGRGLELTGAGLRIERRAETVELLREPRAQLSFEDGSRAVLTGRSPLRLAASGAGPERAVEVTAGDAQLDFTSGGEARLAAETIRLFGTVASPGEELEEQEARFVLHEVEALGRAVLVNPDGVFEGDRGQLLFDAGGAPERAVLSGNPRFRVDLSEAASEDLAALDPGQEELLLEGEGAGPLEIELGPPAVVGFAGPVVLRVPALDLRVDARSGVSGTRDAKEQRLALSIRGAVVVTHGASTLEAPELVIDSRLEQDERLLRMTTPGPSRTEGALADGRPFTLVTEGALSVERGPAGFRVPRAEGVELDVRGAEPLRAHADRLRDFVERPLAFLAEGHVRYVSGLGEGSADVLRVAGPEHAALEGLPGAPARLDFDGGWVEAESVELAGPELTAHGATSVRYELEGTRYDLRADLARLDRSGTLEGQAAPGLVVLDALGQVAVGVASDEGWSAEVSSDRLRVKALDPAAAQAAGAPPAEGGPGDGPPVLPEKLEPLELTAEGRVGLRYSADFELQGTGERLLLRADGSGELTPLPGERLELEGALPKDDTRFTMDCLALQFSARHLVAEDPDLRVTGAELDLPGAPQEPGRGRLRIVAGRMASDETSILLTGGVHVSQRTPEEPGWFLYAERVLLTGKPPEDRQVSVENFRDLLAWGGFVASFGNDVRATGDSLQLLRESEEDQSVRLAGDPAVIELPEFRWAASWFELDLLTSVVRAGPGELQGTAAATEQWRLSYTSIEPVEQPGETIQVVREPVVASRNEELRASWALFWIDSQEWRRMNRRAMGHELPPEVPLPEATPRRPPHPESLFGRIDAAGVAEWLREVYFEGDVSFVKDGRRLARVDSIYLDLVDGHGWIRGIDLAVDLPFMEGRPLKLRAAWMRHSADGSFFASNAVATTCDHEEPHYVVRIGDLKIDPRTKERPRRPSDGPGEGPVTEPAGWKISTRSTSLGLSSQLEIPLPRVEVPVTPDLEVDTERIELGGLYPFRFGSDSKLGTFVGTTVRRELGWLAHGVHRLLLGVDAPEVDLEGQTDYRASWNNDRGALLGLTSELSAEGRYHLQVAVDGIVDHGDDEGLVQVPEDEREPWRAWYRTRGRYWLEEEEWLDLAVTHQEDPGVQAEFFEGEFLEFEERESYLHWRRARGADYTAATAEAHLNQFQSEVVGQEALHARARSAIAGLTDDIPLLYSSNTSLAYLQRERGDSDLPPSPFDPRFLSGGFPAPGFTDPTVANTADGWGEEEALRFDTRQRLEAPVGLGLAGLRATPFVEARGTAWGIGADTNDKTGEVSAKNPARFALLAGAELATTFWRSFGTQARHVVSPFVGWHADALLEQDSEPLVPFDSTEAPIEGQFFDLGVRSRLESKLTGSYLDLDLVETYAQELAGGQAEGWLPLEVLAGGLTYVGGMGFGATHDALYDLENGTTPYSRTIVGFDPLPSLGLEVGYHSARNEIGQTLYNALSASAQYAFSPKWEVEGRYVFSTQGGERLSSEFGIRRLGHDFVFEVSTRFREGEGGGTSFQFDVIPLVAYDAPGNSLVERWRQARY